MPAKASRAAFGEALLELGAKDDRIVTLDADLSKSTMTAKFAKTFPGRAFNLGIAESNMLGVGAGLALTGRIPFACSFACFVVGRFETIRISVAYTNANVKIVGTHSGIAIGGLKDFPICPREQLGYGPAAILIILNDQYAWHQGSADSIGPSFGAISRSMRPD